MISSLVSKIPSSSPKIHPLPPIPKGKSSTKFPLILTKFLQFLLLRPFSSHNLFTSFHQILSLSFILGQILLLFLHIPRRAAASVDDLLEFYLFFTLLSSILGAPILFLMKKSDFMECFNDPYQVPAAKSEEKWKLWTKCAIFGFLAILCTIMTTIGVCLQSNGSNSKAYAFLHNFLLFLLFIRYFACSLTFFLIFYFTDCGLLEIIEDLEKFTGGQLNIIAFRVQRIHKCLETSSSISSWFLGFSLLPSSLVFSEIFFHSWRSLLFLFLPTCLLSIMLLIQAILINSKRKKLLSTSSKLFDMQMMAGSAAVMISYFSFLARIQQLLELKIFSLIVINGRVVGFSSLFVLLYYFHFVH